MLCLLQRKIREKLKGGKEEEEEMGWDVMRERRVKWLYSGSKIELVVRVKGRLKSQPLDLVV